MRNLNFILSIIISTANRRRCLRIPDTGKAQKGKERPQISGVSPDQIQPAGAGILIGLIFLPVKTRRKRLELEGRPLNSRNLIWSRLQLSAWPATSLSFCVAIILHKLRLSFAASPTSLLRSMRDLSILDALDRLEVLEFTAEAVILSRAGGEVKPMGDDVIKELIGAFLS